MEIQKNKIAFAMKEAELTDKIQEYKDGVKNGSIERPCVPDFFAFIGYTPDEMRELLGYLDRVESAYYSRAYAVKRMISWCNAAMFTAPGWSKQLVTTIFLSKQDWGDGNTYKDQDKSAKSGQRVKIDFGAGDPRGKTAGK